MRSDKQTSELIADLKSEIAKLKDELRNTENALKDKSVAKEILDGNLKRILNAVNKISTEKKALIEANSVLEKKLEMLESKGLQHFYLRL